MFYRAFAVAILGFWVLMMTLLVRVEFFADRGALLPVPPEYVWNLMFQHEQASGMTLYDGPRRIGSINLQPRRLPTGTDGTGGPVRLLTGNGSLPLNLPGMGGQNVTVRGSLEMDERNNVQRFGVNASFHTPGQHLSGTALVIDGQPPRDQWHYQLRRADGPSEENTGSAATLLETLDLKSFGLDPASILQTGRQQANAASLSARRGVLHVSGEDIECYVVSVQRGELFDTTVYVSPLGQILAVRTFGGYALYDDAITP